MTRDAFNCAAHVTIAADSIAELRKCDVYRLLASISLSSEHRDGMARYIAEHRPDLAQEVGSCLEELPGGRTWS